MEKRKWRGAAAPANTAPPLSGRTTASRIFYFLLSILLLFPAGCGAPGAPAPRRSPVPAAISDLAARQSGDGVVLTFTLPTKTVDGQPLAGPPAVEIYRDLESGSAAASPPKAAAYTIPSALVDTYLSEGRVRFVDPLKPDDFSRAAGGQLVYSVRTRASKKKDSGDSNLAAVRVLLVPEAIGDLALQVTKTGIELSWTPPEKTSAGGALPALAGYHVYRAEVVPGAEADAAADPSKAKLQAPLALLGVTPSPSYRDSQFEFGHSYVYVVRSVAQYEAGAVESGDSRLAVVTPQDTFPPASPLGLVAITVPATSQMPAHLELSWSISPETDVAGYNVYRSEQEGTLGNRQNRDLLLTPVFRDMSAVPGRHYSYSVTAVSRAGNESAPSAAVSAEMPGESEPLKP